MYRRPYRQTGKKRGKKKRVDVARSRPHSSWRLKLQPEAVVRQKHALEGERLHDGKGGKGV